MHIALGSLDLCDVDEYGAQWSASKFDGWGSPASNLALAQRPRAHGAWAGESWLRARSVTVSGKVFTGSEAALAVARDRLTAAVTLDETTLTVTEGASSRWLAVRRDDEVLWRELTPDTAEWSLQVIATDPRIRGTEATGSTGLPAASGGLTVPFTVPFTIASSVVRGQVSLTNPGTIAGPVRLRIEGPVTGPVVTHVSSGRALVFSSSVVLTAGEWIDVDMEARTVLANGQASRNGWVTSRGWSQFEPGTNTWAFTAAAFDAGSRLTVFASPAWM